MSVSNSFKTLLSRIQPLDSEIEAANGHISTIETRLSTAYDVKKFLVTGSAARGTFIRGKSDIDLFVVVKRDNARWGGSYVTSTTMLDNLRKELEGRFRSTAIYKDVHAMVVDFADCRVDVVPAFFAGMTDNNWPLYSMPDGSGGWLQTCPDLHNAFMPPSLNLGGCLKDKYKRRRA
jgi:tRNA nucleotidyltransferase (CCA-adding enzyme)